MQFIEFIMNIIQCIRERFEYGGNYTWNIEQLGIHYIPSTKIIEIFYKMTFVNTSSKSTSDSLNSMKSKMKRSSHLYQIVSFNLYSNVLSRPQKRFY